MSTNHTDSANSTDSGETKEIDRTEYPSAGPRITPEVIEGQIVSEHYFTAHQGARTGLLDDAVEHRTAPEAAETMGNVLTLPDELRLLTFCVLVLKNGFTVVGTSACASPSNFSRSIGERVARQDAVNKIWPLLGYELRSRLHYAETVGDEDLGDALTHLLAHSLGNLTVLTPAMADKIIGKFEVEEPEEGSEGSFKQQLEQPEK